MSKTALNSCVRYCIPMVDSSLRILPVMKSYLSFEAFDWWFELVRGFHELDKIFFFIKGIF
jgi:hypothetical protein